jgi:hypothetical protein
MFSLGFTCSRKNYGLITSINNTFQGQLPGFFKRRRALATEQMADNKTNIGPGRKGDAPDSSLSMLPLQQDLPGTQSMIVDWDTLPLGIVLEEVSGLCVPTHPFTRAYINFQRLTEDFGINVYTGSFRKYKLSRTQNLVLDILHEWMDGRLRPSTDPLSGSDLQEVLQQIAVFAGSIIKEDVWTRENDRFCLIPSQVLAGDIPDINALGDSIYTTSLWRLFFLEFYFNKNDIDDKFLGSLHSYRQYCLCIATTQRVSLAFLPELKDYRPRAARELGGKVIGEPDTGSSLEFCPWLRSDPSTSKGGSTYDDETCPRFLWDIDAQKTVDARNFEKMPSYRIISHTWGRWGKRDSDNKPISSSISSVPWPVPQNTLFDVDQLPEMLKKIQDYPGIQYVWIDLLCIPQYGASEEFKKLTAKEIAKQAQIFKKAIFPILWLNNIEDWSSTEAAIEWLSMEFVSRNVTLIDPNSVQLVESKLRKAKEEATSTGFGEAKRATETVQIEVDQLTEEGKLMFVVIHRKLPPTLMIIKTFEEFLDIRENVEDNYDLFVKPASQTNRKTWETQLAFSQPQGTPYVLRVRRSTALGREFLQFNNLSEATDFILPRLSLVNTDDSYDWAGSGNNRMILIGTATDLFNMKEGSKHRPKTLQGSEQIAEYFSNPSNIDPSATVAVEFKPMSPDEALEIINLLQGSGGPKVITLSAAAAADEHAEDADDTRDAGEAEAAAFNVVDAEDTDNTKAVDDAKAANGDEALNLFLSRFSSESGEKYQDLLYKAFGSVGFIDERKSSLHLRLCR